MSPSEHHQAPGAALKVARIYMRVSTEDQDLNQQDAIVESTKAAGLYIAGIYREQASDARADRAELLRLIADLQPGEVVVAETSTESAACRCLNRHTRHAALQWPHDSI